MYEGCYCTETTLEIKIIDFFYCLYYILITLLLLENKSHREMRELNKKRKKERKKAKSEFQLPIVKGVCARNLTHNLYYIYRLKRITLTILIHIILRLIAC